eukprot:1574695-Pyramimonas_sp.AAC.1
MAVTRRPGLGAALAAPPRLAQRDSMAGVGGARRFDGARAFRDDSPRSSLRKATCWIFSMLKSSRLLGGWLCLASVAPIRCPAHAPGGVWL